jgi:hypothetical protein
MGDFRREPTELTFLLDEDVKALKSLFPKKGVKTLAQVRLKPGTPDSDIARKAWDRGFTIVTANADHFRKAITDFQERGGAGECACLGQGLQIPYPPPLLFSSSYSAFPAIRNAGEPFVAFQKSACRSLLPNHGLNRDELCS